MQSPFNVFPSRINRAAVLLVAWGSQAPVLFLGASGDGAPVAALLALTVGALCAVALLQPTLRGTEAGQVGRIAGGGVALGGIVQVAGCLALAASGLAANQAVSFIFLETTFGIVLLCGLALLAAHVLEKRARVTAARQTTTDTRGDDMRPEISCDERLCRLAQPTKAAIALSCFVGLVASFMMAFAARPLVPLGATASSLLALEGAIAAASGTALAALSGNARASREAGPLSLAALFTVIGVALGCALTCASSPLSLVGSLVLGTACALAWGMQPLLAALPHKRIQAVALSAASGVGWASALGCIARQTFGLDAGIFAVVALAALGLVAVLFSLALFFLALLRHRSQTAADTAQIKGPLPGGDAARPDRPSAQDATRVIAITRESILASFGLSPRETQVALYMLDGLTTAEAADQMGISTSTAKFHLTNVYKKAGVQSKFELIRCVRDAVEEKEEDPNE